MPERHEFTAAVNHEYKETDSNNSALSFLKFHPFKITFFEIEKLQIAKSILHEVHNNKNKIFSQFCVEHTVGFFFFKVHVICTICSCKAGVYRKLY